MSSCRGSARDRRAANELITNKGTTIIWAAYSSAMFAQLGGYWYVSLPLAIGATCAFLSVFLAEKARIRGFLAGFYLLGTIGYMLMILGEPLGISEGVLLLLWMAYGIFGSSVLLVSGE